MTNIESFKIERLVSPESESEFELAPDNRMRESKLRPKSFADFPGQERVKKNLEVYVKSARKRKTAMDHVLLHGPPGLGKTSLARIVAQELGVSFVQTSGPAIDKPGDLVGILTGLDEAAVVFIDEIHRLSIVVEEVLYSAMEDFFVDVIVGQGPTARSVALPVKPFTLIGATTKTSLLSAPLMSRFGIQERFDFYSNEALEKILERSAAIEGVNLSENARVLLAERSRGTPRIVNRLLKRVWDFAVCSDDEFVDVERVEEALAAMEIDKMGLEPLDRLILKTIYEKYDGGPVGIDTLSYSLGEDRATIEEVYEPYLVFKGFITRGSRGREITELARKHLESETKGF